jgi:hypothetical protein
MSLPPHVPLDPCSPPSSHSFLYPFAMSHSFLRSPPSSHSFLSICHVSFLPTLPSIISFLPISICHVSFMTMATVSVAPPYPPVGLRASISPLQSLICMCSRFLSPIPDFFSSPPTHPTSSLPPIHRLPPLVTPSLRAVGKVVFQMTGTPAPAAG